MEDMAGRMVLNETTCNGWMDFNAGIESMFSVVGWALLACKDINEPDLRSGQLQFKGPARGPVR